MKKPYSLRQDALEIVISIGIGILQWGFSTSFFFLFAARGEGIVATSQPNR